MELTIITEKENYTYSFTDRVLLSEALSAVGLNAAMPCGGRGRCGKCRVRASGSLSDMTAEEAGHLTDADLKSGIRLSCMTYATGDACVYYSISDGDIQAVSDGFMQDTEVNPLVENGYAAAIDIGTTTIAAYLYKFPENICVETRCGLNSQTRYGSDVITRISFATDGGMNEIKTAIGTQLGEIIKSFSYKPEAIVITGNTAMLYLLTGTDPSELAVAPYHASRLFGEWHGEVYLCPCASAYVGADLISAVLASGMTKEKKAFLVDIGTNGEMALWNGSSLKVCSTAAGPALEGAEISMGMTASDGAINKVFAAAGKLRYTVIGDSKPVGICGTGLVDAIAGMLLTGIIDETGYLEEDYIFEGSDVCITAQDIRKVQLAKSAIRSGIDTLLKESGTDVEELDSFYIAGGFGSYLDKASCIRIGMIPIGAEDRIKVIGNGAGSGASMLLKNKALIKAGEELARSAVVVELATSTYFMDKYIENMMF